jgi:hypothetical protein
MCLNFLLDLFRIFGSISEDFLSDFGCEEGCSMSSGMVTLVSYEPKG